MFMTRQQIEALQLKLQDSNCKKLATNIDTIDSSLTEKNY